MTAETSNARGEVVAERHDICGIRWVKQLRDMRPGTQWFIEGREWPIATVTSSAGVLWHMAESEIPHGTKYYAAPPPADAEPKTLPAPARAYLTDKAAVIVGDPQRGWDEEGPEAHNCDDMGCSSIGPHVLARVPFTDERAMSQPAEARGGVDDLIHAASNAATIIRNCVNAREIGEGYAQHADDIDAAIAALTGERNG